MLSILSQLATKFRTRVGESRATVQQHSTPLEDPIGAMARLQLARALMTTGDVGKAKAAYENLLELWKDAEPDLALPERAKAEFAALR